MSIKDAFSGNKIKDTVQIDMQNLKLKGDVIDIGVKNYGIIYKICRQNDDEVAVEYLMDEEKDLIEREYYHTAVLFFTLSPLSSAGKRRKLIKELYKYIRDCGEIIIWDINKAMGRLVDLRVEVLLSENETQTIKINNFNPIKQLSLSQVKKIINPYFEVTEEKQGKEIFFLRAKRKNTRRGKKKDESSIDCIEC
ncbi:hypothetical protein [Clostridium thermarum]|uniref:hypothetical protein n=1 Tax=Clostridium thermarum TaxID=1716543 RepID=UPI001124BF87|nr:hypothetical protein [Clostridium thermarum]